MVTTMYCTPDCGPKLGHTRQCPRWDQNTAVQKKAQLDLERGLSGVPDAEYEETDMGAPTTNGHAHALPAAAAPAKNKTDRLFDLSSRLYLNRIEKGETPSRTMAAECVDTARMLVSEVERDT